jgi:hypothetical protein
VNPPAPEPLLETAPIQAKDGMPRKVESEELNLDSPRTPTRRSQQSFGYAVVTPPSTLNKTYLPARQRYGLVTPPETPEALLKSLPFDNGNQTPTRNPASSLTPTRPAGYRAMRPSAVSRKPLPPQPVPSIPSHDPHQTGEPSSELVIGLCTACRQPQILEQGHCACADGLEDEQIGCLRGWSLRRIRNAVGRKVTHFKAKLHISPKTEHHNVGG